MLSYFPRRYPPALGIVPLDSDSEWKIMTQIGARGLETNVKSDLGFNPTLYQLPPELYVDVSMLELFSNETETNSFERIIS